MLMPGRGMEEREAASGEPPINGLGIGKKYTIEKPLDTSRDDYQEYVIARSRTSNNAK